MVRLSKLTVNCRHTWTMPHELSSLSTYKISHYWNILCAAINRGSGKLSAQTSISPQVFPPTHLNVVGVAKIPPSA